MKKGYLVAGVALLSLAALQGCSNSSSAKKEDTTYSYVFVEDPTTLDYTVSGRHGTSQITTQGVDGLLENDRYGNLIPSLAKDWKVSSDGLTYTYTLRKGVKWYTSDGDEYAEVTADDFVTGLKHAADKKSSTLYIVQDSIKGLNDYVEGTTKDFSEVGIKAVDKYTVQYTLNQPESYWNSKTTYGILQPVNADFLKSKGDDFGSVDPSSILYNGAFLLKSVTSKSSIEFEKNENYWDADKVSIDNIKLTYNDGSDPESLYKNFDKGNYTRARLYPTKSSYKDIEKKYKDDIFYTPQDQSTYYVSFNLNRKAYEFTSKENDSQKTDTHKAILNKDFRQAITFAFDRTAFAAQALGEEGAVKALRSSFVPPAFVSANGKEFGDFVKEELASDSTWNDVDLSDAQDGFYNVEKAKASFEKAKTALEAEGVQFPIHLDIAANQTDETNTQQISSLKQSIEFSLGKDNVVVDVQAESADDYERTGYYAESADQKDYDLSEPSGWGPDYDDPSTYLDVFKSEGVQSDKIGVDGESDEDVDKVVGLDKYTELVSEAAGITDDLEARYKAYAKAQAWLTDSAIIIPLYSKGAMPVLSKIVPFSPSYATSGVKGSNVYDDGPYKYYELQDEPVTAKQYEKALKKWEKAKEKSNKEYQEKLSEHVED
ncbi:peptide ABC transporter substrate-binding protein [Streptococcus gallolyticus]|uniref:peptide ABC transporter substrate-binding protein n=1 Tax=Streptococcus gallolyticus TaxID=315405 RepID=UPI000887DA5B|nr:peptide ABC transporter substrate-binding protein [Streptococcus gallolyticus]SDJ88191.1 oligopeptide transport system substrate-binding protein [Streptococcus gallolyticus]SDL37664.1 oligopeptide transport system substrate-binding protein [Streptococcus gallolyticus]